MTDIVERLNAVNAYPNPLPDREEVNEAIDEIERLRYIEECAQVCVDRNSDGPSQIVLIGSLSGPAPGHTDLMVAPESIDDYLEGNPPSEALPTKGEN